MKLKFAYSAVIITLFGILGASSIVENGSLSGWGWFLIIAFVCVCLAATISDKQREKEYREQEALERKRREEERQRAMDEYKSWYKQYIAENGTPDKTIVIKGFDKENVIHVHENIKHIYICGKTYDFKDVMSCTFSDSPTVIKGTVTAVTKANTGSTVGRAIVGDVIAGPAGAIIGGTTGKKTTEFLQENDRTVHDYTVVININSIANPILRIHTGEDGKMTNEIVGLMNVIIARK
jgi:O6-methylguanine-DNA--protein-cysteine methyltransferase